MDLGVAQSTEWGVDPGTLSNGGIPTWARGGVSHGHACACRGVPNTQRKTDTKYISKSLTYSPDDLRKPGWGGGDMVSAFLGSRPGNALPIRETLYMLPRGVREAPGKPFLDWEAISPRSGFRLQLRFPT